MQKVNFDKAISIPAAIIYLIIFLCIAVAPNTTGAIIDSIVGVMLDSFGFVYIAAYAFVLIAFLGIGVSKFGRIRLGKQTDKPEFSFMSWMGMLFGAGLGVGLVFYGVSEPVSHFMTAPYAVDGSAQAAADAMQITFFHWSFLPWCLYGMVGLCIAFFLHCKGLPGLVSSAFQPLIGDKINKWPGKAINAFSLIAVICGVSMSLGFATTQLTSGLGYEYGIPVTFMVVAIICLIIGAISLVSALSGVEKGIKYISDLNLGIVIFFLIFVLLTGSTFFVIKKFFEGFGNLFANLPWMMFFADATGQVAEKVGFDWVGGWTMMYWAWWAAFAPFVGGFLARISKGRTIREFVLACAFVPALICCLWFAFFGGEAIGLDLFNDAGIGAAIAADSNNSLFMLLGQLPIPMVTIPLSMLLIVTLIVTSVNSATYVAAQISGGGKYTPSFGLRLFWGIFIIANALFFIYLGGLDALKSATIMLAFPFILIVVAMVVGLLKGLREYSLEVIPPAPYEGKEVKPEKDDDDEIEVVRETKEVEEVLVT